MDSSKTALFDPKLNLNPHCCNTLFLNKKDGLKEYYGNEDSLQNSLGETECSGNPYFLTGCLSIQFFDSPPFPIQLVRPPLATYSFLIHPPFPTQLVRPPLANYSSLCSTCVTYGMPYPAIGHQVLLTQPPN